MKLPHSNFPSLARLSRHGVPNLSLESDFELLSPLDCQMLLLKDGLQPDKDKGKKCPHGSRCRTAQLIMNLIHW